MALSCWDSSGFDLVRLASVGILVSGSAPAAWLLLSRSLKWRPSSSVQIRTFNWPPAPWTAANYSSPSFPALHRMSFSCIAHTILSLAASIFCAQQHKWSSAKFLPQRYQKKEWLPVSLRENCILFGLYFVHKGRFYKKPTVVKKKVLPQTLWHKNERRTQGKMRTLQRW